MARKAINSVTTTVPRTRKRKREAIIEADEQQWETAFKATTPNQIKKLEQMFLEEEEREGTLPLDFTDK